MQKLTDFEDPIRKAEGNSPLQNELAQKINLKTFII